MLFRPMIGAETMVWTGAHDVMHPRLRESASRLLRHDCDCTRPGRVPMFDAAELCMGTHVRRAHGTARATRERDVMSNRRKLLLCLPTASGPREDGPKSAVTIRLSTMDIHDAARRSLSAASLDTAGFRVRHQGLRRGRPRRG